MLVCKKTNRKNVQVVIRPSENVTSHNKFALVTGTQLQDPLICGDDLVNNKAKLRNDSRRFYEYYESFIKSSWSGS